jgi:uncharacterized RDD family membrane protein YckC
VGFLDPPREALNHETVSQDPKKPFDAPPDTTPALLQKEIPLDRRNRRVPTFEELRAEAPTDPERTAFPLPSSAPTERLARPLEAIPQTTVPATPSALSSQPVARPRNPVPPPPRARPPAPPQAHPPAPPQARPPAPIPERTTVVPPRTPSSEQVRTMPPSPAEWARLRGTLGPLPQVTAGVPSKGASIPPGQPNTPSRAQPVHTPQPAHTAPTARADADVPEPPTNPARAPVPPPAAPPSRPGPSYPSLPSVLPPELLVTQPGLPGPFADSQRASPRPLVTPEPMPAASPSAPSGPASQSRLAALGNTRGQVLATPASLWRRVAAWLVDASLLAGVVTAMLWGAAQVIAGGLTSAKLPAIVVPLVLLTALLSFVYTSLFAFVWGGRSPGRRVLGLHLVDSTGRAPSPTRSLVRGALSLVSFGLFLSGFWLALFDRRGQTLHDKLSSTFVVQLRDA